MIIIRPATMKDSDTLFAWRNDPQTQAASRSTAPVPREDHDRWMRGNVMFGYPEHMVMMAGTERGCVGVVRFDSVKNDVLVYEVSITLAPQHRGKHLATEVLRTALDYMGDYTIHAEIRKENIASRRIFEHCGFEEIGREDGFLSFKLEPTR